MMSPLILIYLGCLLLVGVDASIGLGRNKDKPVFECESENGLFAYPGDCRRYYVCKGGFAYDTSCPPPLYFDDSRKHCDYKSEDLQCGPWPWTTPFATTPDPDIAPSCDPDACQLPDCFCSDDGTLIPGGFGSHHIPQMVILTFTGAINFSNIEPLLLLLDKSRFNINECPIRATFFVPHENTSYYHVEKLHGLGHEIAVQSITNREPEQFWSYAPVDDWLEEVIGQKEILHHFANVSRDDILGMRAPFLKPGGDDMFAMIYDYGLDYDSSIVAPLSEVPLWPYTLDYQIPHKCISENCPTRSFPGIWEFPLNTLFTAGDKTGTTCAYLDECDFPDDIEVILDFLIDNLRRHYISNRAPFVMNFPVNWVTDYTKFAALNRFLDFILDYRFDAWFVTMQQAIEWLRNPIPKVSIRSFEAWKCSRTRKPRCGIPRTCRLELNDSRHMRSDVRYMQLCDICPKKYPWLNNIRGTNEGLSAKDFI